MTSKISFLKLILNSIKEKEWTIVLSFIASLFAGPVVAVLLMTQFEIYEDSSAFTSSWIVSFSLVAIAGALICAIIQFKYLHSTSLTDYYHSLPISRGKLFFKNYLTGLTVYIVPLFINVLITLTYMSVVNGENIEIYFFGLLKSSSIAIGIFLLVYHLGILGIMLTGTLNSSMVTIIILGTGFAGIAISILGYFSTFDTYCAQSYASSYLYILSPLANSLYVMVAAIDTTWSIQSITTYITCNVGMIIILGVLAYFSYMKRKSELAESGMKNKFLIRSISIYGAVTVGLLGAVLTWQIIEPVDSTPIISLIIGSGLTLVTYLVVRMVFVGTFTTTNTEKVYLAVAVLITVTIASVFSYDLINYENKIVPKDEISNVEIFEIDYNGESQPIASIDFSNPQDSKGYSYESATYEFLQEASINHGNENPTTILAKVSSTNGGSYTRRYQVSDETLELLKPVIESEEAKENYYPSIKIEELMDSNVELYFSDENGIALGNTENNIINDQKTELIEAYYKDISENYSYEMAIKKDTLGNIIILTQLESERNKEEPWSIEEYRLPINEEFTNTQEVIQRIESNKIAY